jgi:hypothetical protein
MAVFVFRHLHTVYDIPRRRQIRNIVLVLTAFLLVTTTAFDTEAATCAELGGNEGYNPCTVQWDTTRTDWMSPLPDDLLISELSIPGTHESHGFFGGDGVWREECGICQCIPFHMQLKAGIRAFDIRIRQWVDAPWVYHGAVNLKAFFGQDCWEPKCGCNGILTACVQFLEDHPGETILMRVKANCVDNPSPAPDAPCLDNQKSFSEQIESELAAYAPDHIYLWPSNDCRFMPTLGETRGKIVILQDFQGAFSLGNNEETVWPGPLSCTADFNSDGFSDLAGISASRVTILLNDGHGMFVADEPIHLPGSASSVCSGDFNLDGFHDLAVTLWAGNTVFVYVNLPGAGFEEPLIYDVGSEPSSSCAGDIDGDSDVDILVANSQDHDYISVLRNDMPRPDVHFDHEWRWVGNHPIYVALADLDNDDRPDLFTTHYPEGHSLWNSYVKAWTNDGWHASGHLYFVSEIDGSALSIGTDLTGDGLDELILAVEHPSPHGSTGQTRKWLNSGSGFEATADSIIRIGGPPPIGVDAADMNDDDNQDLIFAWSRDNFVQVLLGDGNYGFHDEYRIPYFDPVAVTAEDFDLDSHCDLAVTEYGPWWKTPNRVSILRQMDDGEAWCPGKSLGPYWNNFLIQDLYAIRGWTGNGSVESKIELIMQHLDWARDTATTHPDWMFVNFLSGVDWRSGEIDCDIRPCEVAKSTNHYTYLYLRDALDAGEVWRCGIVMADYPGDGLIDAIISHNPFSLIADTSPVQNELDVPASTDVSVVFEADMNAASFTDSTFVVTGMSSGPHNGVMSYEPTSRTATLDPSNDFAEGEIATVVLTEGVETSTGILMSRYAWSFTTAVGNGSGIFPAQTTCPVGTHPRSVFSADLDGDEDLDLVSADEYSHDVAVLLNQGDGTFAEPEAYSAGAAPFSVFASDLDGDEDLDLAIANYGAPTITVLMNRGDGTFADVATYSAGGGRPRSVFAADLNLDGHTDLMTANHFSDDVSVLLNEGDGTFAEPTSYGVSSDPRSVFAADLDGDGDPDLATANLGADCISVLFNRGGDTFSGQTTYVVGHGPSAVFAADLDIDGDLDLTVSNYFSANVSVLMNQGNGTFAAQTLYGVGANPSSVFASDLDGDGDLDLATANSGSDNVSVLVNQGDGIFADHMTFDAGDEPYTVFASDLDGDGVLDLATSNLSSNDISVLPNAHGVGVDLTTVLQTPTHYALYSPAPNPFDPTTKIAFDLPSAGHVSLKIYNVAGQCVRTLVNEPRDPGRYSMRWDGRSNSGGAVAHGVYFARLTSGSFTATRKLVRVR